MGVFIDVKTFDNHIRVILIMVIKKKCVEKFIDFSFCDFLSHKTHISLCVL